MMKIVVEIMRWVFLVVEFMKYVSKIMFVQENEAILSQDQNDESQYGSNGHLYKGLQGSDNFNNSAIITGPVSKLFLVVIIFRIISCTNVITWTL